MGFMNQRLEVVDFLKGFSIFTIVVMHLCQFNTGLDFLDKVLSFGGAGVHVFILCSGFGLYLSHLKKPLKFTTFLKRRFTRVYLPYIIVVLLSAIIPFYWTYGDKVMSFLSHVFLFKMFFEQYECSFGGQMWFVSTIIQFYLFWSLIVLLFERLVKKNKYLPVIVGCVVSIIWSCIVVALGKSEMRIWNSFFLQYFWEFLLGMFFARMCFFEENKIINPSFTVLVFVSIISLGLTGYAGLKGGVLKMFNDAPSLFAFLCLSLILYKIKFTNSFFVFTSKFSYEWYLVHILVFHCSAFFLSLFEFNNKFLVLSSGFVLSYYIGYLYSRALSFMKFK